MASTPPDLVRERLRARARRIRTIRRRITAAALATFALAFGVIATTGSLGSSSAATTTTKASSGSSTTGSEDNGSSSSRSSGSSDSSSQSSSSGSSSVTTSQS